MKTLMVVSGGDAPGINATLGAYTHLVVGQGGQVVGAKGGFAGVLGGEIIPLSPQLLMPWSALPGSLLPSSREPVLGQPDAQTKLNAILTEHQIDNIMLFGGDGSLKHLPPLLQGWGIPCIGIPTTIDNNVVGSEETLGFDSACNFAYATIDGIRATAHALPGRIFIVETLGGDCGNLALAVGIGGRAHAVLLPEYSYEDDWLSQRLKAAVQTDGYALLVISEGVAASRTLPDQIPQWTGIRVRDTRLGHAQRGGATTHRDRFLAAQFARLAYTGFQEGITVGTTIVKNGEMSLHRGLLDLQQPSFPDRTLYNWINGL